MQVDENCCKKRRHEDDIIDIDIDIEEDPLSSLPDNLLINIIGRLGIESGAATSVLSHRWRYLWTNVDRFHLVKLKSPTNDDGDDECKAFHTFCTTFNHILEQIVSPKIRTFHLTLPELSYDCKSHLCSSQLGSWLRQICPRDPEEIEVIAHNKYGPMIPLPLCVLKCPSLVTLAFWGRLEIKKSLSNVVTHLPNLKSLKLEYLDLDFKLLATLIKSCSLLESLYLLLHYQTLTLKGNDTVDISAPNLKYLSIKSYVTRVNVEIVIDAPKLQVIFLDGVLVTYSFRTNPNMLYSASIGFDNFRDELHSRESSELFTSSVVKREQQRAENELFIPKFSVSIGHVLQISSCLTSLRLECMSTETPFDWAVLLPVCVLSRLKKIELVKFLIEIGGCRGVKFVEYLLSNAHVLEELYIDGWHSSTLDVMIAIPKNFVCGQNTCSVRKYLSMKRSLLPAKFSSMVNLLRHLVLPG